jgi:hypothetical protein
VTVLVWVAIGWAVFLAAVLGWARAEGLRSCRAGRHDFEAFAGRCLRCKAVRGNELTELHQESRRAE